MEKAAATPLRRSTAVGYIASALPLAAVELADWHMWWKRTGARELRDVVLLWWDPVSVYGVLEARDEYDGYLGSIGGRLREGAGQEEIAAYLADVSENRMGLRPDPERDNLAAGKIVEWFEQAMSHHRPE